MNNNFIISLHKDKQSVCIILCNSSIILDCHTIYNTIFETIQKNETYKDITLQDLYDYKISVFLDSILLLGSSESPNNPLFFGELESAKQTMIQKILKRLSLKPSKYSSMAIPLLS